MVDSENLLFQTSGILIHICFFLFDAVISQAIDTFATFLKYLLLTPEQWQLQPVSAMEVTKEPV